MRSLIRSIAVLAMAAAALGATAAVRQYRGWALLPVAYFLTDGERVEWKRVESDEQAEAFIARYFAVRGPLFARLVEERIVAANRAFSSRKVEGARTLRGRIVILLGAPDSMAVIRGTKPVRPADPLLDAVYSNAGPAAMSAVPVCRYSFTYAGGVRIDVDVDEASGAESIPVRQEKAVGALLHAAAQKSRGDGPRAASER